MNRIILLSLCLIAAAQLRSAPAISWEHQYPKPTANALLDVTWGAPGFVAVSDRGEALFSTNGVDWTRHVIAAASNDWVTTVSYHDGRYFAASLGSLIVMSTNGRDWNEVYRGSIGIATACAAGNGSVVVSYENLLLVSTNGMDWEQRSTPASFLDIAFGNGLWVAATGGSAVYHSTNLVDWTRAKVGFPGFAYLPRVTFGNGVFVIGGARQPDQSALYGTALYVSTNAIDWNQIIGLASFGEVRDMTYGAGQFLGVRRRGSVRSTDGFSWQGSSMPEGYGDYNALAVADSGRFVVVGAGGSIAMSDDGVTWQRVSQEARIVYFYDVCAVKGTSVAVGSYSSAYPGGRDSLGIVTSTNGTSWQPAMFGQPGGLTGVAYGNRRWMAVGSSGRVLTSRNGVVWDHHDVTNRHINFRGLAFGRGRFVSLGEDHGYYSAGGRRWRQFRLPNGSEVSNPKFVHGRFFALGGDEDGLILTSRDGTHWRKTTLPGTGWLAGVAHGNGRYVAAGLRVSAVSRDGANWEVHPVPRIVDDLVYVNGWFVGVVPNGVVLSRDGEEWEVQSAPPEMYRLSLDGDTLIGAQGATLYRGVMEDLNQLLAPAR